MWPDLQFAFRGALKRPGFVAAVCGTLALGVAAATTMFTFVNSILLNPLPYSKPDELVQICMCDRTDNKRSVLVSVPDLVDWKQHTTAFAAMAYYWSGLCTLTGVGDPEPVVVVRISEDLLPAFQVRPYLGRWFMVDEFKSGPDRACILSYRLWQKRFDSDPQILGKTFTLNGKNCGAIVGVMPASYSFPEQADVALTSCAISWETRHRGLRSFPAIGRLKPGVQLEVAQAELTGMAKQLEERFPETNANQGVRLVRLKDQIVGDTDKALRILFGAVCCVLVIACANIASLLMVRAVERKKEFAIRIALGANRLQIANQPLMESLLLAVIGGMFSILVCLWSVKLLVVLSPARLPRLDEVHIDSTVLLFCFVVSLMSGIGFGLVPVLQTFKTNVTESLNEEGKAGSGSHRTSWMRGAILLFQVALTVVLMIGAGLFIRTYSRIQSVDLGFNPDQVVVSKIALRTMQYPSELERNRLFKPLLKRLEKLPEKKSIALAVSPPFTPQRTVTFAVEGVPRAPGDHFTARLNSVSGQYFEALGMRVVAGRNFGSNDGEHSPRVAIINQSLAKKCFGSQDPIGQRITLQLDGHGDNHFTVIGMVNDVHQASFVLDPEPELYFQLLQLNDVTVHVVAKVEHAMDFSSFAAGIKKELQLLDDRQAAGKLEGFDSLLARSLQVQRFRTYLLTCFAGIALILSAVGIFGFLAYTVGQRTREIGILAALGAPRTYIIRTVMKETAFIIGVGVVIGLSVAFAAGRFVESFLFEVRSTDIPTFLSVAAFIGGIAAMAAYFPTRKAASLEVMAALRS